MVAETIREILDASTPPPEMAAAPIAPARGPQILVPDYAVTGGGLRQKIGAHFEAEDELHRICTSAWRRHKRTASRAAFVPPLSLAQITVARHYRTLVEWREGSPLRGVDLNRTGGGGGDGGYIDAYMAKGQELAALQARIGSGAALSLRRIRPSLRGSRRDIRDRDLLDAVVLGDMSLRAVLRAHGWALNGDTMAAALAALSAILDRMARAA